MAEHIETVGVITQDEAGNYFCDGLPCVCSLGSHAGLARTKAIAAVVGRLSAADYEVFAVKFDDDEAGAFEWARCRIRTQSR